MKIALIRSASVYMNFGSYNVQEIGLAKSLEKIGYQVDFYTREKVKKDKVINISDNIRVYAMNCISLPGRNGYYPQIYKYLDENHYDLIQVLEDSQIMTVLLSIYAKRKNIPFVLWQGMYENYHSFIKKSFQFVFDLFFLPILRKNTDATIGKTTFAISYIKSKGFTNNYIGGVGLDIDIFKKPSTNIKLSDVINVLQSKKILLYIGAIEARRNPRFLIDVVEKLHDEDVILVFAGDGPELPEITHLIKERKLEKSVKILGRVSQENLIPLYQNATMFLLPTDYEIYGMVILECMYYGLPVLATPCAGSDYLIDDNVDGFICEKEEDLWVKIIRLMLRNNTLREKLANKFKDKFEKYTWDSLVCNYIKVYETIKKNKNNV